MADILDRPLQTPAPLGLDIIRLVAAARAVAFGDEFDGVSAEARELITALDKASEEFADRIPWDDEPGCTCPAPIPVESCRVHGGRP